MYSASPPKQPEYLIESVLSLILADLKKRTIVTLLLRKIDALVIAHTVVQATRIVDHDTDVLDLQEVVEHDVAWRAWWIALGVVAAPERMDALPLRQDGELVLAEQDAIGFCVHLLVGEKQTHGLDDEAVAITLLGAWHDHNVAFIMLEGIISAVLLQRGVRSSMDFVDLSLGCGRKLCNEQLLVDLVAYLRDPISSEVTIGKFLSAAHLTW